ncbi:MAG: hypothetical protein ACF8CQ_15435 [Rhodopirellula sp. JB044]
MTRNQHLALVNLLDCLTDPILGGRKTRFWLGVFVNEWLPFVLVSYAVRT